MRRSKVRRAPRLIAANVDTQFIITASSDSVDAARRERYIVLTNEGGTTPVLFLTKVEEAADVRAHLDQVRCPQNAACRGMTRRNI
ncbi:GTPase RsgA [Paracoccus sp. SM22M-07]|uniref:GTPase RsgA n=1 Tax=Paracoccus sp. SM22M-07 TaxID=1520813 RepID=UPI001114DD33|nr:GTPase RsgA [Paracoccus sp. SM22M-07]